MGECPFCAGEVSEDILLFGGTCPHCFATIPGEEAATDPGEAVKSQQEQADRRRAQRRALVPVLLALPIVAVVAGVSIWFALQPEPELAMFDLDEGDAFAFDFEFVAEGDTAEEGDATADTELAQGDASGTERSVRRPTPGDDTTGSSTPRKMRRPDLGSQGDIEQEAEMALRSMGTAEDIEVREYVRRDADRVPEGLTTELGSGLSISSPDAPTASRGTSGAGRVQIEGPPLVNQSEIRSMVAKRLRQYLPRLRTCYTQARNARPELEGEWRLQATVQTDGSLAGISFTGVGVQDEVLEACALRQVERWRFQRISKAQPFSKTLPFRKS